MGEQTDDGKIRIRCTGCGKRVKFPKGLPGQTYRCPGCHTTIIAPIGGVEEETAPPPAAAPKAPRARYVPPTPAVSQQAGARPSELSGPAVDRFNSLVLKETHRMHSAANALLLPSEETPQELAMRLNELRHIRAIHIKDFAHAILKDLDRAIAELKENPAAETDTIKQKIQKLLLERRNFLIYLSVMFELRPVAPAKPDTRGSAAAQPTTPSQPALQTPPDIPPAAPGPGDKAPGSSSS